MSFATSTFLEPGNPELQDRLEIFRVENRMVLVVADGAGGRSGAAEAAEFVIRAARGAAESLRGAEDCFRFLCEVDHNIAQADNCGETTGVIVVLSPGELFGANVGDSVAWLFAPDGKRELSHVRKPYLGSGVAAPHQFASKFNRGTVVVASDGLWKYTSLELIEQNVKTVTHGELAKELGNLVRLRSGAFPDDIAIVSCRIL